MKFKKFLINILGKRKTPYYVGGFPEIDNLGDVALYESMNILIEDELNIYPGGKRYRAFSPIFKNNIGVLSGGTIINRHTLFAAKEGISIFKKFYVLGTGVTQKKFWTGRDGFVDRSDEWSKILSQADFVGVRGPDSVEELKVIGVESICFGDPVIQMTKEKKLPYVKNKIGLNIGLSGGHVWGSEVEIKEKFLELATKLKNDGFSIEWFVVCPEDLAITEEVAKASKTDNTIHKIYTDCEDYFSKTSTMEAFIGLKLHAVMMAMCVHVPSIMIEYRPKCLDFMKSVGQEDFNFRSDQIEIDRVIEKLSNIISSRDKASDVVKEQMLKIKRKQKEVISDLI